MKRKILLAITLAIFLAGTTNAQIEKKDWLLGGTAGFNNSTAFGTSNANLAPHIVYAVGNNSVIGLNFAFSYSTQNLTGWKRRDLNLASNIIYRKYFVIKNNLGWYSGFSVGGGIGFDKQKQQDSTHFVTQNQSWNVGAGFVPGIYYRATPTLLLTADFGGVSYNYFSSYGVSGSEIYFNFLTSFTFGVDFILKKHKG
jgi:hypothetical protein